MQDERRGSALERTLNKGSKTYCVFVRNTLPIRNTANIILTSLISTDVESASNEFSTNSLTTLKTDVITCELPSKRTVSDGSD